MTDKIKKDWREGLTLTDQQYHLLKSGIQSDCNILVGDREVMFCAHKIILLRASSVFETLCFNNRDDINKKTLIRIKDMEPSIFHVLLRFIYTDQLPDNLSVNNLMLLCIAANKFLIYNLHQICIDMLKEQLNLKNFWTIFQLVTEENKSPELLLAVQQFLSQNTKEIFKEESISKISKTCMVNMLQQTCQLNINSELDVINTCLNWASCKCNEQNIPVNYSTIREILGVEIISNIRFLSLDVREFVSGPGREGWLTLEEKNEILTCFAIPEHKIQFNHLNTRVSRCSLLKRKTSDNN